MNDKSYVSLEKAACPICAEVHATGVVLDRTLRDSLPNEMVTHYEFCPDCKEKLIEYIALIEAKPMDKNLVKAHEPERTGRMVWVKRDVVKSFKDIKDMAFITPEIYSIFEDLKEKGMNNENPT